MVNQKKKKNKVIPNTQIFNSWDRLRVFFFYMVKDKKINIFEVFG